MDYTQSVYYCKAYKGGEIMGQCNNCGASVIDGGSWKEAYCSVLGQSGKSNHTLRQLRKLFDEHLMIKQTTNTLFLEIEISDAARLGVYNFMRGKE